MGKRWDDDLRAMFKYGGAQKAIAANQKPNMPDNYVNTGGVKANAPGERMPEGVQNVSLTERNVIR